MSSDDEAYEVDYLLEARCLKKDRKKTMEFLVRWKGYDSDGDTWEPIENFQDITIDEFWAKTRETRDPRDVSKFSLGDHFLPLGPPRTKKPKRKSTGKAESSAQVSSSHNTPPPASPPQASSPAATLEIADIPTGKRRRGPLDATPKTRPQKRQRESASTNGQKSTRASARKEQPPSASARRETPRRKKAREPSIEVVPDSDEDVMIIEKDSEPATSDQPPILPSPPASASARVRERSPSDPLFDEDHPDNQMPAHRLRQKKPLVKTFEDPALAKPDGQLSAKTRATRSKASESAVASSSKATKPGPGRSSSGLVASSSKAAKPGPGRSSSGMIKKPVASLLTASKGTLKTVKGKYKQPAESSPPPVESDHEDTHAAPEQAAVDLPTGQELLSLAGLDAQNAENLSDFDDISEGGARDAKADALAQERAESLKKAHESLFPNAALTDSPGTTWSRSTIFGPLTSAKETTPALSLEADPSEPNHTPFTLTLDSATSVPVLFTDVVPGGHPLVPVIHVSHRWPPGQFYSKDAATSVLDAVRSSGIAGRVVVSSKASEDLKVHFQKFSQRLQEGDLFVATAGIHVYAFCSSDSRVLCSRMNISPGLQVADSQVLVCKIAVDNFSGYVEVAGKADMRQWSKYVASEI
ncbi:hypothetical protein D9611_004772 [Ephemerocybe angulata]|uniref:Chromo domain-containing protein n=1 Tax=Ephemerocybe angulata TaxID=980116 RepID=A0A8H5B2Z6_9AGAR|nr:hypothetical protein D9611_004772 [Tulosesus angulatus]